MDIGMPTTTILYNKAKQNSKKFAIFTVSRKIMDLEFLTLSSKHR